MPTIRPSSDLTNRLPEDVEQAEERLFSQSPYLPAAAEQDGGHLLNFPRLYAAAVRVHIL